MSNFWTKYRYRLTNISEKEKQNPLMYLFFWETFCYGFAFTFFPNSQTVTGTILYQLTTFHFAAAILSWWGVVAMLVVIGSLIGIYLRKSWLGQAVSIGGFCLWLYALILYAIHGFGLQVAAVAGTNLVFWTWWFFLIMRYHRQNTQLPTGR